MSRSKNTLILLNSSPSIWRAMEEFHYRLAKALIERGARVVIVLAKEVPLEIRARFESSGATVHYLAYRRRWTFYWELRRLIRETSIARVHIRFFRLNQLVSWLVRLIGVRTIIYTDAESNESNARGLKRFVKRIRTRLITTPNTRLIAISEFVKRRMVENGVPESKIDVVHNGVDLTRFTPDSQGRARLVKRYAINPDALILTTISRLVEVKRVDVILRACNILKSRGLKFRLLIAGQGGPLAKELEQLSDTLGLTAEVIWIGQTDEPENILQGSDLFVLASCGEAFGNVLVEAMACGVPVVATRSGAIPEILLDGVCGLLAEPGVPECFAERILRLAHAFQMRKRFAAAAIEQAKCYNVEQAVQATLAVHDAL